MERIQDQSNRAQRALPTIAAVAPLWRNVIVLHSRQPDDVEDDEMGTVAMPQSVEPPPRYSIEATIATGAYGSVHVARDRQLNRQVALKRFEGDMSQGIPQDATREISLLRSLSHPNIVRCFDVFEDKDGRICLVLELATQSLRNLLRHRTPLPAGQVKRVMHQILAAINHCHSIGIMHRDLKPDNVLMRGEDAIVADFGMARTFYPNREYTQLVCTLWYRAPEILLGSNTYTPAVDMWSVGCIFAELVKGTCLFEGDSQIDTLFRIFRLLGTPNDAVWSGVAGMPAFNVSFPMFHRTDLHKVFVCLDTLGVDLLESMLEYNPRTRISAAQALRHPYFTSQA